MRHEHGFKAAERNEAADLAGLIANRIRRDFRDLSRIEGFDRARETMAGIINLEAERKAS